MLLAAINFVLLALAVSSVNPRVGRSGNLLFALFAFVIYYNLLNLGQSWISSGRSGMGGFMLLLHGGVALFAISWLTLRNNNWARRKSRGGVTAGPTPPPSTPKLEPDHVRTIRRLIYIEALKAVAFVTARLPEPVLLLRLRRRAAVRRPPSGLRAGAGAALRDPADCRAISTSCCRSPC